MAEPQRPTKTTGLALNGRPVLLDDIPDEPTKLPLASEVSVVSQFELYEPSPDVDYTDLYKINNEIIALRRRLHILRKELRIADRKAMSHQYEYQAAKKRTLVSLSGGSATERESMAELLHEGLYTKVIVSQTVAKEITQHMRDIRTELDSLRELSYNLRRQIDIDGTRT